MPLSGNLRAIVATIDACAMFGCMDAVLKALASIYPPLQLTVVCFAREPQQMHPMSRADLVQIVPGAVQVTASGCSVAWRWAIVRVLTCIKFPGAPACHMGLRVASSRVGLARVAPACLARSAPHGVSRSEAKGRAVNGNHPL